MHPLMQAAGHRLLAPDYTGLWDRAHLADPDIDLEAHIQDIVNVITSEHLRDVVLLGHSYGGMVATGVADRARDVINQVIYLDAFVPCDGECLLDFLPQSEHKRMRDGAAAGDGWRIPPNPSPPDTSQADLEWMTPRRVHMPIKCFEGKLKLQHGETTLPRSYIYCSRKEAATDPFAQFAKRLKNEADWRYFEMDASHSPNVTAPEALMAVLQEIVA
jgi:pimeloyl-ACP methyl ester carboxylesterase